MRPQMGMRVHRQSRLAEPDQALVIYMDGLLAENQALNLTNAPSHTQVATQAADRQKEKACEYPIQPVLLADSEKSQAGPVIPDWAGSPFEVLLFKLNGLMLGIPLASLVSIQEWNKAATPLPGAPGWHLGVLECRGEKVVAVDTARLIMPEKAHPQDARQSGGHLLQVGDGSRALAVDRIDAAIVLEKQQVSWRRGLGKRPWLAGIMIEQLSVLLDADGVLSMIAAT